MTNNERKEIIESISFLIGVSFGAMLLSIFTPLLYAIMGYLAGLLLKMVMGNILASAVNFLFGITLDTTLIPNLMAFFFLAIWFISRPFKRAHAKMKYDSE